MKNKKIGIIVALASTVLMSSYTAFATETEIARENDFTNSDINIATPIDDKIVTSVDILNNIEIDSVDVSNNVEIDSLNLDVINEPILAVAVADDSNAEMEAQVILGDGTFSSSNRATIEEKGDYTFIVSGLDMGKDDFGNIVLTFDFAGSQLLGENIEDINIDVTELKIGDVSFNVEGANYDKSEYDLGFRLFDIIKGDEEAYANAFSKDGDTSETEIRVNSLSVSIHVNTLKLDREEPVTTTTLTTTTTTTTTTTEESTNTTTTVTTTEKSTTSSTVSVTQPATTTNAPNTTIATTTAKPVTTTSTKKSSDDKTSPQTGDAGIGGVVAILTSSVTMAFISRKRRK